jgi:hypothetical protein
MKITICGSIAFYEQMVSIAKQLEEIGHEVKMPPTEVKGENGEMIPVAKYYELRKNAESDTGWIWDRKEEAIRTHFEKVEWSDAVLVLNHDKKGIEGYVGANTFLEIGLAFHLNKKIFFLNKIPEISCKEELLGMKPIVIDGDLSKLT